MRLRFSFILPFLVFVVTMWLIMFLVRTKQQVTSKNSSSANQLLHMMSLPVPNTTKHSESTSVTPNKSNVTVLSRGQQGTWTELSDACDVRRDFVRAQLSYPGNTSIFVYDMATDIFVSGSIIKYGVWEGDLVRKIHDFLKEDPERVFLDLGANVGVFSLMAAKIGHKVFSVDMLLGNVQRLCASCLAGNFPGHVTIINNALSDVRGTASFRTHKGNVGGTSVKNLDDNTMKKGVETIPAILLDDLLEIFKFKKVVIKMDLETFEEKVLKGGEAFFKEAKVEYILMEFGYHRTRPSGRSILEILDRHGMIPMLPSVHDVNKLTDSEIKAWPAYVTWKRKVL